MKKNEKQINLENDKNNEVQMSVIIFLEPCKHLAESIITQSLKRFSKYIVITS